MSEKLDDKFIKLCNELESLKETDMKHLVSCIHLLWLTKNERRIDEAVDILTSIAMRASIEFRLGTDIEFLDLPVDIDIKQ